MTRGLTMTPAPSSVHRTTEKPEPELSWTVPVPPSVNLTAEKPEPVKISSAVPASTNLTTDAPLPETAGPWTDSSNDIG